MIPAPVSSNQHRPRINAEFSVTPAPDERARARADGSVWADLMEWEKVTDSPAPTRAESLDCALPLDKIGRIATCRIVVVAAGVIPAGQSKRSSSLAAYISDDYIQIAEEFTAAPRHSYCLGIPGTKSWQRGPRCNGRDEQRTANPLVISFFHISYEPRTFCPVGPVILT